LRPSSTVGCSFCSVCLTRPSSTWLFFVARPLGVRSRSAWRSSPRRVRTWRPKRSRPASSETSSRPCPSPATRSEPPPSQTPNEAFGFLLFHVCATPFLPPPAVCVCVSTLRELCRAFRAASRCSFAARRRRSGFPTRPPTWATLRLLRRLQRPRELPTRRRRLGSATGPAWPRPPRCRPTGTSGRGRSGAPTPLPRRRRALGKAAPGNRQGYKEQRCMHSSPA
jgi:hypothetical protein